MSTATPAPPTSPAAAAARPEDTPARGRRPRRSRERPDWVRAFSRANLTGTLLAGYLPMAVAILLIAMPLLWMVVSSFTPVSEIVTTSPRLLPLDPTGANYADVAARVPLGLVFLNSLLVTGIGAGIKVFLAITSAYALVFLTRVPLRRVVLVVILVALMVPPEASLLPNYLTISQLGGRNSLWGIILPGLGTAFGTFLLRQQFLTLPTEILEAAELDGAGHWRRLWRIVVPVMAPTIATVALVTVVSEWNAFLWPLVITDKPEMMTLPVGLNLLNSIEGQTGSYGILMAGAVMVIVPILLVFAALQRYIVAGLTQGAVK